MKLEKEIEQAEKLLSTLKEIQSIYQWIELHTKESFKTYPYTYPNIVWNSTGSSTAPHQNITSHF